MMLCRAPLRCAPVQDFALVNQIAHRAHCLFDGRVRVGPVAEIKIEIIDLQPAQRGVAGFDHMFAAEAHLIGFVASPKNLARHDELIAWPAPAFEDVTHHCLRLATGVAFRVVEEIDARVKSGGHQLPGGFTPDLLSECDPRSERKRADLQTGFSKASIFHMDRCSEQIARLALFAKQIQRCRPHEFGNITGHGGDRGFPGCQI